ncbi:MAG: hypothetical protein KF814_13650 [Nitrospiraceae bacterium]|nr:hypothetical protein [Nitrospiraceae bacterium]
MEIVLDQERWQVADDRTVMEALGELSDRVDRDKRMVVSLTIGGKPVTDRDLVPALLERQVKELGTIEARSRSLHDIVVEAKTAIDAYALQLHRDGTSLVSSLRSGLGGVASIDSWLGRLADYAELLETGRAQGVHGYDSSRLAPWIREVLEARSCVDAIRMADLLEYELLPRLIEHDVAA